MPTPKTLMKRYRKYRGLLYSISAAFAVAWKCEVEEPLSLALVLFCDACWRYDPQRNNSFRKYLTYRVRWGLTDEGKVRASRAKALHRVPLLDLPQARSEFDLTEFIESLSPDARLAVSLALSGTGGSGTGGYRGRVQGGTGGRMSRERLTDILSRRGWTRARSRQAFAEVREALE